MGSKDYQQKYGLDMVEIPIFQAHSDMKETGDIMEKESVVVATKLYVTRKISSSI